MKNLETLNHLRDADAEKKGPPNFAPHKQGAFRLGQLFVIASTGFGWDHVSVSTRTRCPTWGEMEYVKRMFFEDHETAMQLHVPPSDHVNCHPYCLHLWRPQEFEIPRPPPEFVGIRR